MKAKKILVFMLIVVLILITLFGMNSVTSMDNLAYVVAVGFDIKDTGKLELSFQIALPSGSEGGSSGSSSSQSSSSIVTSVECNSFESGVNLVNSYLSKELNLSHCKAIVFSEEIASQGIGEYLYTLINHVEIRPTCNVIISKCNAKYFLNNSSPMLDQLSSKYYEIASTSERVTGYTYNITLLDFFSDFADSFTECFATLGSVNDGGISSSGSNNNSSNSSSSGSNNDSGNSSSNGNNSDQSSSSLSSEGTDDSYVASETPIDSQKNIENLGLAVFKGDKLVGELNGIECIAHLILTNELDNAVISVPSPFESTNYIDLYLTNSKCKTKVYLTNGTPYIKPSIDLSARIISMSDDYKDLTEENIELIEEYAKYYVERFIYDYLYKTAKVFKSDITAFGKYAVSNFATIDEWNEYNWLDNYQNSFFNVDINVDIVSRYLLIDTWLKFYLYTFFRSKWLTKIIFMYIIDVENGETTNVVHFS